MARMFKNFFRGSLSWLRSSQMAGDGLYGFEITGVWMTGFGHFIKIQIMVII